MDAINRAPLNRQQINRSLILSLLIIIMDLSGMAGTIVELDESAERQETLSGLNMPGFDIGLVSSSQTFDIYDDGESSCAVLDDSSLWCWGKGGNYALGRGGNTSDSTVPVPIGRTTSWVEKTASVSLGGNWGCELLTDGVVQCWGTSYPIGAATAGGNANNDNQISEPEPVLGLARDAVLVGVGDQHACAILDNGTVQCWGYNYHGQLGLGYRCVTGAEGDCSTESASSNGVQFPRHLILPTGKTAIGLNIWHHNTCVILDDNSYICTGDLDGVYYSTPLYMNGSHKIIQADEYSALSDKGTSLKLSYQGSGLYTESSSNSKMYLCSRNSANTSYANCSNYNSSIRSLDGSPVYWGEGYRSCFLFDNGSVGCGDLNGYSNQASTYNGYLYLAWFEPPNGKDSAAVVSKDGDMTCIMYDDGSLYCWGKNDYGQIGDGSTCVYGTSDETGCTSNNYVNSIREVTLPTGRHIALDELDSDGDTVSFKFDDCPTGNSGWTSSSSTDHDSDGCQDSSEDTDDDNDGVTDTSDSCSTGELQWTSSSSTDYDSDGCQDSGEDTDDDNDGVADTSDNCPAGIMNWTPSSSNDLDSDGCRDSDEDTDDDNDGWSDSVEPNCLTDPLNGSSIPIDTDGDMICNLLDTDDDNDGFDDSSDTFPLDPYSHVIFAEIDAFRHGIRYENITAAGGQFITEGGNIGYIENGTSEYYQGLAPFRSLSDFGDYRIYANGTVRNIESMFSTSDPVSMIADGNNYHCALLESSTVQCWGSNDHGQLGDGTRTHSYSTPVNVTFPSGSGFPVGLSLDNYNDRHSCALMDDGDVYCWGDTDQIGLGTQACQLYNSYCDSGYLTQPIASLQFPTSSPVESITSSSGYRARACAVHEDGAASCWGEQQYGELGNGYIYEQSWTPTAVAMPSGSGSIVQMAMVHYVSCALMDDGEVYCWGRNTQGALGDGTVCPSGFFGNNCNGNSIKPVAYDPTILPTGTSALSIWAKSAYDVCALLDNGRIYCWGEHNSASDGIGQYFSLNGLFVHAGNRDWDGDGVYNSQDNCAAGTQGWTSASSNDLDSDGCIDATEDDDDDGDYFTDSGEVACGTDPLNASDYPLDVDGDGLCAPFDDDDDGDGVLDVDDEFPDDENGFVHLTLGDGFQAGQPLDNVSIGGSQATTCAILTDASIKCWGDNNYGQVGDGSVSTSRYVATNVSMPSGKQGRSLSHGSQANHLCAIMTDGSLYCWGYNYYGQIGDGTTCTSSSYLNGCNGQTGRSSPVEVSLPTGRTVTAVSTGVYHTCAILDDGSVWCWGYNDKGQLGVGNMSSGTWAYSPSQTLLPTGRTATAIASGENHNCAVLDDNSMVCWGEGEHYRLGNTNSQTDRSSPTYVTGSDGSVSALQFSSVAAGKRHTCSITTDNDMYCWGYDAQEQLGNVNTGQWASNSPLPVNLPAAREAMGIIAGDYHTCAILDDESMYCWGYDNDNRLNTEYNCGSGDYTNGCDAEDRDIPAPAIPPSGRSIVAAFAGSQHTCVLIDNGGLYCFGTNQEGQLGNGSNFGNGPSFVDFPVAVSLTTSDRDSDHDGVFNNGDRCMDGATGWTSNSSTDNDFDGCRDSDEDLDDDNDDWTDTDELACGTQSLDSTSVPLDTDGDLTCNVVDTDDDNDSLVDTSDDCSAGEIGWISNSSTDYDSDGCQDSSEDTDDDNDLISDTYDSCTPGELSWTSSSSTDHDTDGCQDSSEDLDDDNDNVADSLDSCPTGELGWSSDSSTDNDGDGCKDSTSEDLDDDNDGWSDTDEAACGTQSLDSNSIPVDTDGDLTCDVVDNDDDNDGYLDSNDEFPLDSTEWVDTDNDGTGNNADTDDDNDGWTDAEESACGTQSLDVNSVPLDTDGDGTCNFLDTDDDNDGFNDGNDTFPLDDNEWLDTDNDSIGNNADLDDDNDGWNDTAEISCGTDSLNASSIPTDTDGDGICDTRDPDDDNDGYLDSNDSFPLDNTEWADTDNDSIGNNADLDDDGDNVTDSSDAFPLDGTEWEDTDGDGIGNNADTDDDNDGLSDSAELGLGTNSTNPDTDGDNYTDGSDAFPLDNTEWEDTDGDGIGNNADLDDDADSWDDLTELSCASDPLDNSSIPLDTDNDGDCNLQDTDDDNDGTLDVDDAFPLDASADTDTDSDGMPDIINGTTTTNLTEDWDDDNDGWNDTIEINCGYDPLDYNDIPIDSDNDTVCDTLDIFPNDPSEWEDTDGDGYGDNGDAFPTDSSEWNDTDGDGIGDNADPDADNDGWFDNEENQCNSDWLNSSSVPSDVDNDGLCNEMDSDADDDGWSNDDESDCFTDWLDDADIPLDTDGDSLCDVVDGDDDNDLYPDDQDAFPLDYLEWEDSDSDGIGNNQDPDDDNDGCMDIVDSHPIDPTECSDNDGDGYGDNADPDDDNDGTLDYFDDFPFDASATTDTDGDGMPDDIFGNSTTGLVEDFDDDNDGYNDTDDAFPLDLNEWIDTDGDGLGNNADPDDDGDSCADVIDLFPLNPAECYDYDLDGIGDNADLDDDNDGWEDNTELICGTSSPFDPLDTPDDFDQDGICDILDYDDDNDTIIDAQDAFPFNPCASIDTDGDGLPDFLVLNCNTTLTEDLDDDNDGYNDTNDSFPQDPNEWSDFDNDGYGDNYDTDDDGDTVPDIIDSFPLNSSEWFDNDGDGIGDNSDTDDDNDGILDVDDDFPFDFGITTDTDGDGLPDNMTSGYNGSLSEDLDDDGDGVLDIYDQFPLDATEWMDTDLDGIGNNADSDDDGDGWSDNDEWVCGTDTLDANDIPDDSDGDGICDSEDEEDLTTLTGRAEYYLKAPVTVWMALVGIIAGMLGGATSTSFRARKEREQLYSEMRDFTDSVRDYEDYDKPMRPMKTVSITESKDSEIKKLVDQGYSEEVAEALINSQR
jgi:alpha-tubulin suppressor-like RCC1 family protein